VPTIPTTLSIRTLGQLADFLADVDRAPIVLPFVSMLDPRQAAHRLVIDALRGVEPRFSVVAIGNSSAVERTAVRRAPLGEVAPRSAARKAFRDLWAELTGTLWPG
jgi:chromosome partitioning protein